MKDLDNIEDWYRNELDNYNVQPDNTVWNSLSENLDTSTPLTDDNISDWYKKEVAKLEERPDYTVWEKLATKLDTASVWDKLALSLNRYDQLIWWRNVAIRGSAVLLLLFGSYLTYNNYTSNNDSIVAENNIVNNKANPVILDDKNNSSEKPLANSKAISNDLKEKSASTNEPKTVANKELKEALSTENTTLEKNVTPEEKVIAAVNKGIKTTNPTNRKRSRSRSKENSAYASMGKIQQHYSSIYIDKLDELKSEKNKAINTDIERHSLTERDISHMYSGDFLVKKDNDKIIFNSKRFSSYFQFGLYARRVYVGFNAGLKKQGMLTKLKENSPLAAYKQNSLLDFGNSFGGTVGFIVSDNFNIETNISINSTSGYKRSYIAEGVDFQERLDLNYTSLSLLAKKMNNKSTFDNKVYSTNIIAGVYASILRSQTSNANGVSQDFDAFNKTDFGLVLGIEQDRYITKTLVITPGVRFNQGLTNNANENSSFESARNFSLEFNLGVKYIFLKKGK